MSSFKNLFKKPAVIVVMLTVFLQLVLFSAFYIINVNEPENNVAFDLSADSESQVTVSDVELELSDVEEVKQLAKSDVKNSLIEKSKENDFGKQLVALEDLDEEPKVIIHKLVSGDTLASIWNKYTSSSKGSFLAAKAFKQKGISLNELREGEELEVQLSDSKEITALKKQISETESLLLTGDSQKGYTARLITANVIKKDEFKTMSVDSSIARAAYLNGLSYALIDDIVDIFSNKIDFRRDIHPGDTFSVLYEDRKFEDGSKLAPGPVKAALIKSGGSTMYAIRYVTKSGKVHYFDRKGNPLGSNFLRYPLKFSRISSVFNKNRFHPVLKRRRPHNGVDFAAPTGTPVRSIGPGVVQIASWKGGGGKTVKIRHNGRYSSAYLHLSKISKGIRPGVRVEKGQVIGKVGMTGLATGPHLHFSLYDYGKYVDPLKAKLPVLAPGIVKVSKEYLESKVKLLEKSKEKLQVALNGNEARQVKDS